MSDLVAAHHGTLSGETTAADLVLTVTTNLLTSVGSNLPAMLSGDLFRITGLVAGNAAMNGDYTVTTVNASTSDYLVARVDLTAIATTSSASAEVTPVDVVTTASLVNVDRVEVINMDGVDEVYFVAALGGVTAATPEVASGTVSVPLAKVAGYKHVELYPSRTDVGTATVKLISQTATQYSILVYGR